MRIYNDNLDDPLLDALAPGFTGVDSTTAPVLLADTVAQYAKNVYMDEQGLAMGRPAVELLSAPQSAPVRAAHWYDIPGRESLVVLSGGVVTDFQIGGPVVPIPSATYTDSPGYRPVLSQLVDSLYRPNSGAGLTWYKWSAGAWTSGTVTTWDNNTAMPVFGAICAHRFRLFASPTGTDELYASDVLEAQTNAKWKLASGLRIGSGEGDPIVGLVSFQETLLLVLKEASLWLVDTGDTNPANWVVRKLTGQTGCSNGRTVVQLAQDVIFMSRYGVVSIGALQQQDTVSPANTISAPMRASMQTGKAVWATRWREFYLLAWDSTGTQADGAADKYFVYNTQTRAWCGEWTAEFPPLPGRPHLGWTAGVTVRPGGVEDTVVCDGAGRVCKLTPARTADVHGSTGYAGTIPQEIVTKSFPFGEPDNWKRAARLEIVFHKQGLTSVSAALVFDGETTPQTVVDSVIVTNFASFPLSFPITFFGRARTSYVRNLLPIAKRRFRECAVRINTGNDGRLALRAVKLAAFPDTAPMTEA